MKQYLLALIVSLAFYNIAAQNVVNIAYFRNEYFIDSIKYSILTCNITNICTEDVLIWVDDDTTLKSNQEKIYSYFIKQKGDFSLVQLVNENIINDIDIIVFYNFIKILHPDESFQINIICKEKCTKVYLMKIEFFIKNNIIYLPLSTVNQVIDMKSFEDIYYQGNFLFLEAKYIIK